MKIKVHPSLFIATFRAAGEYGNGSGQMWEDIAPFDMEQGQMDVKKVSWLI